MPVRKKATKKPAADVQKGEVSSTSLLDSSCKSLDTTNASMASMQGPTRITKSYVEQRLQEKIKEMQDTGRRALNDLDNLEAHLLMLTPPEILKKPVCLDKMSDWAAILDDSIWKILTPPAYMVKTPATVVKSSRAMDKPPGSERPRRSISHNRLAAIEETISPRPRSSSVEPPSPRNRFATPQSSSALQTPANRLPPSRMLMTSKYTVRKPHGPLQPNIPMKRVMRAGEEAISTSGSPLFVQGRIPNQPEINIPLENGVILNIDPNNPDQRMAVPTFDPETVKKIRILCRKLESCIGE